MSRTQSMFCDQRDAALVRARKLTVASQVKCDEAPGTCGNCERVLLACRWPQVRNVLDDRATSASVVHVKQESQDGGGECRRHQLRAQY